MSALPAGTVTFLFTDIEGSTRLWERHPEAMQAAVARHDGLLGPVIAAHSGHVFKKGGDAFYAVFDQAAPALAAALAVQQALHAEVWPLPQGSSLSVRMALHTGAAERRDGDYFGGTLSRVARLLSAAHGGQTLVSEATAGLAGSEMPPGTHLRSLGRHRLKDLTQPQEIFQLLHDTLPADFPPLRSLESFAHNLPSQLTSFIGREREMAEARRRLSETRLLTLTGMGGAGKSRLAVQVAADVLEDYPEGVWLVELAALTDPALVPQEVAATLGLREEPDKGLPETLIEALRPKTLLLVLDNCEHLIEACARLTDDLLRGCPRLQILTTSREALGIGGETTLPLSSLSLPTNPLPPPADMLARFESVRLFVERATVAQPAFRFSAGNAPAVALVCSRLDGIPLALELAAARVKVLSPEQIASRLDDRFRLLSVGSRTALPRQQTLRALIDWSYDLLPSPEQALLRRLSVFVGGWSLEAAEAVCAGGVVEAWEVLDLLSLLVSKSLVVVESPEDGPVRYHLLENLHQYAHERLAETEDGEALPERHHNWFLKFAEEAEPNLSGEEQSYWLNRLERDHDNFRRALKFGQEQARCGEANLRLAVALYRFWLVRGYLSEGIHLLESCLEKSAAEVTDIRAKALNAAGVLAWSQGKFADARGFHEKSLRLHREIGDRLGIAHALTNLGILASHQADYNAAQELCEESLGMYRALNDTRSVAALLNNLGGIADDRGDLDAASPLFEESLRIYRQMKDAKNITVVLQNLGDIAFKQGDYREADRRFIESLRWVRPLEDQEHIASLLDCLASVCHARQNQEAAAVLLGAGEAIRERMGIAWLPLDRAQHDTAVAAVRETMDSYRFRIAWACGREMTTEQAMDYALQQAQVEP